jgi:hypothetical protein
VFLPLPVIGQRVGWCSVHESYDVARDCSSLNAVAETREKVNDERVTATIVASSIVDAVARLEIVG